MKIIQKIVNNNCSCNNNNDKSINKNDNNDIASLILVNVFPHHA